MTASLPTWVPVGDSRGAKRKVRTHWSHRIRELQPRIQELGGMAESVGGSPVFERTDVPIEYVQYQMDIVHKLYAYLLDYPSPESFA